MVTMSHRTSHSRKSEQAHWRRQREQREVDDAARRRHRQERERHTQAERPQAPHWRVED